VFGSEVVSVFLTKHRCNPLGKEKKTIYYSWDPRHFSVQNAGEKKADECCFLRPAC
jgi:hypothetical protein